MKVILIHIVIFLYIFGMHYIFLPVGTRVLLGVFGFSWFILLLLQEKSFFILEKSFFIILLLLFSISLISAITISYNGTFDIEFIRYTVSMIANIFASYFVIKFFQKLNYKLNFKTISNLLINVISIQSIIALSMFLSPDIKDFLLSMEKIPAESYERIMALSEIRFYGIGAFKTFTAGIYNGFALMLIAIIFRLYTIPSKEVALFSLKFLVIFVIGMMTSRTTLVGAFLAIIIIILPENLKATISMFKKRTLFFMTLFLVTILIVLIIVVLSPELLTFFEYGFEMFVKYFEKGSFETASTNEMMTLYVMPTEIKTWIIGDGYFAHPTEEGSYYMHTDIGYLRLIYYFGMIGLLTYLSMQVYLIVKTYKSFDISIKYYIFIIAYLLILNLKGFSDLFFLNMIFLMSYLLNKNRSNEKC